jgi:hypothetical protein
VAGQIKLICNFFFDILFGHETICEIKCWCGGAEGLAKNGFSKTEPSYMAASSCKKNSAKDAYNAEARSTTPRPRNRVSRATESETLAELSALSKNTVISALRKNPAKVDSVSQRAPA